jgi:adenylate cyclase, class 2
MPDIEVEAKYPLTGSLSEWRDRLLSLGAQPDESIRQTDEYFAHPARDFVATGEAFRIRTVGDWNALTYKGPLLDPLTKSRRELEIEFASGATKAARMRDLLMTLGFRPAGCVQKTRTQLELNWRGRTLTLALDEVDRLGLFLEIEIVAPEHDWQPARDVLLAFAAELGLSLSERRSYLELLTKTNAGGAG